MQLAVSALSNHDRSIFEYSHKEPVGHVLERALVLITIGVGDPPFAIGLAIFA